MGSQVSVYVRRYSIHTHWRDRRRLEEAYTEEKMSLCNEEVRCGYCGCGKRSPYTKCPHCGAPGGVRTKGRKVGKRRETEVDRTWR